MDDHVQWIYAGADGLAGGSPLRELLAVPDSERELGWLRRMLQYAVRLEFTTIPPYLTAMWSIIDPNDLVVTFLSEIAKQEMLHMGTVCNLLNAIGETPVIDDPAAVPCYPTRLPGGVNPRLHVGLERISKDLVCEVFMGIEEPEFGPVTWYRGQTYPTIGAFYTAIEKRVERLRPDEVTGQRQVTLNKPDFKLKPIQTVDDALDAIRIIRGQGEGTSGSPLFGPSPFDVAHYYRFGEIYHEKQLTQVAKDRWCYSGAAVPFPKDDGIYPMAPVPPGGYPAGRQFDQTYTSMLHELQAAWVQGGPAGAPHLANAMKLMTQLGPLAVELMKTEVTQGSGTRLGPGFQFIP